MIICTLFNPAIDAVYRLDGFESGGTHLDVPLYAVPSGKGLNVARVVRALGEDAAVAGLVPANDVRRFSGFIADQGITPLLHEIPGSARINATLRDEASGAATHINSASARLPVRMQDEFLEFLARHIEDGAYWCFSGSLPVGFDHDAYARVISLCKERGCTCLLDTRGLALKMGARALPQIMSPNILELQEFFGEKEIKGVHHIALLGKRLIDLGVEYVFITLGSDGVIALSSKESDCLLCSPPTVKTVDTVGCGDAFAAGVIVARKRQFSFIETCRMAIACGSSKSMHEGPGVVTLEEVWRLMEEVKITAV